MRLTVSRYTHRYFLDSDWLFSKGYECGPSNDQLLFGLSRHLTVYSSPIKCRRLFPPKILECILTWQDFFAERSQESLSTMSIHDRDYMRTEQNEVAPQSQFGDASVLHNDNRAGFLQRLFALLIDLIIVYTVSDLLEIPLLVGLIIYASLMWRYQSTTVGGMALGLRVVRLDAAPLDWGDSIVRALSCLLSALFLGLGFLWVAFDSKRQSWHDKIVGTTVIKSRKPTVSTKTASPNEPPLTSEKRASSLEAVSEFGLSKHVEHIAKVLGIAASSIPRVIYTREPIFISQDNLSGYGNLLNWKDLEATNGTALGIYCCWLTPTGHVLKHHILIHIDSSFQEIEYMRTIAHEMRHCWQQLNRKNLDFPEHDAIAFEEWYMETGRFS